VTRMKERVDAYRVFVGQPEEKRLLRRPGGGGVGIAGGTS